MQGLDELGLGVSIYFKLLKSLVLLMLFMAFFQIPVMFIYGSGGMTKANNTDFMSYFSLGNIGQSQEQCWQGNYNRGYPNRDEKVIFQCPGGTKMTEILHIGIQKRENTNICPKINTNSTGIIKDYEQECWWKYTTRT